MEKTVFFALKLVEICYCVVGVIQLCRKTKNKPVKIQNPKTQIFFFVTNFKATPTSR